MQRKHYIFVFLISYEHNKPADPQTLKSYVNYVTGIQHEMDRANRDNKFIVIDSSTNLRWKINISSQINLSSVLYWSTLSTVVILHLRIRQHDTYKPFGLYNQCHAAASLLKSWKLLSWWRTLLWKPKVHYRDDRSPQLDPILSQKTQFKNFTPCSSITIEIFLPFF
jgi:hypothetical protein